METSKTPREGDEMGFLSKLEGKMEDTFEGAADKMANSPLSPVQIAKKAEKQMRRNKMVGAGKQYAPTLYTVLVNADDDERLFGYYPTLAGETETYLSAKAAEEGLLMDGQPLVRFIVDEGLRHGKFDVVAEPVAAPLIAQLRAEEMARYGIGAAPAANRYGAPAGGYAPHPQAAPYAGGYDQPAYDDYAEGDGYSEEWKQEAARRGLTNICHVPEALMHYVDNQSKSVLIGERIFNETELNSRLEVELEKYTMKVQIEGRVLGDLAINHIVPTAVAYQNRLLENLRGMKEIFSAKEYEVLSADRKELIREISHRVTSIKILVREMTEARKVANHLENYKERAFAYEEKVRPYLDQIRDHIDHLEMEVDDEIWPLPKYRELLFTK